MSDFFKSKKGKILIVSLTIVALLGVSVGGYFIFRKKLKYDYAKGAVAAQIVENAQYTPDMDKFAAANFSSQQTPNYNPEEVVFGSSSVSETTSVMTETQFQDLIDEYATVENYAGAGKYLGYDIYELKNEIKFVVEQVPAFNQWFRMPGMREKEGYVNIPYYENWAYYLSLDEEERLTITRVCWCTRSRYLDFENQKTVEDKARGKSFVQYEVMQMKYYANEENKEVVECYLYSVGIDNVKNGGTCNKNTRDYYPFEYQYLKNVEDTSLIKYHITVAQRYSDTESFDEGGMDIRGLTPYGIRREFILANYDGYTEVELTKIDQQFATLDHPEYNGVVSFNMESNNIKDLVKTIGLSNAEYEGATDSVDLLNKIAKQIIDNFEIKNNWPEIYRESTDGIEVRMIKGPHYGVKMPISDVDVYVSTSGSINLIHVDLNADVYDMSRFDISKEYSLSVALRNRESGNIYIVGTSYTLLTKVYNNGSTEHFYYRFEGCNVNIDAEDINLSENGEYDLICVLTEKVDGDDVVMFNTLEIGYLRRYSKITIPNSVDENSVEHKYDVKGNGGKLTIIVSNAEQD